MINPAADWLILVLVICAGVWLCLRSVFWLPFFATLAAWAVWFPTGHPRVTSPPPGRYVILGHYIDSKYGISLLIKGEKGPPMYYYMTYSKEKGSKIQNAVDEAAGGGTATLIKGESGGESYDGEPPVQGEERKTPEQPAVDVE